MESKKNWALVLLSYMPLVLLGPLSMDMYLPALPDMASSFGVDATMTQLTLSIFTFAFGCCQLLCGEIAVRFGRERIIALMLVIYCIATIACAITPNIYIFLVGRFMQAFTACACRVLAMSAGRALISDDNDSIKAINLMTGATALAPLIAPSIGVVLIIQFGHWRYVFWGLALLGCISLVIFLLQRPDFSKRLQQRGSWQDYSDILSHAQFWQYTLLSIACMSIIFLFFSISPSIMMGYFAMTKQQFGLAFSVCAGSLLLGSLASHVLRERLGYQRLQNLAFSLILVCSAVLNIPLGLHLINFIIAMMLVEFALGLIFGPVIAAAMQPFINLSDKAASVQGFFQFLGACFIGTGVMIFIKPTVAHLGLTMASIIVIAIFIDYTFQMKKEVSYV